MLRFAAVVGVIGLAVLSALGAEPTITEVEGQFRTLPMEARRLTGPLFWLHGDESRAQLEGELQKVLEGRNGTFTTESRPHKDWLGEGWYRDVGICLDFARKNNLTLYIFDDWWWPSQMMGGRVLPQYGSKRLVASDLRVEGPKAVNEAGYGDANLIAVVAGREIAGGVDGSGLVDLTASVRDGTLKWSAPAGTWRIMKFTWKFNGTRGGQQRYVSVDGADPECVDWFIKTVYQPHYDRFKADYGKTIVGYFYDEPETQGDWGRDVSKLIAERKLDLNKLLVAYKFKLAGEEQTAAYYTYLDCFAESWGRTMYGGMSRWCREHKVVSMGHFMEHGDDMFSRDMSGGNMMQLQKYSDMGGIDLVCHQLHPGGRGMGIYQTPKIASSISHTYNKDNDIAFSEIYGGYDQVLTYPTMKWLADWHQVRGVNFLIPHSFNPRAPRDGDFPPYFYNGGYEPRWPLFSVWADYTNRLSLMLSGGRHVAPVALLHLGQSYHVGEKLRPEEITTAMQDAQFDCDWLLYDAWEKDARLENKLIRLHKEDYRILVVPAAEVIPYPTLAKARDFFEKGGVVVGYGMLPSKSATLGQDSKDIAKLRDAIWGPAAPGLARCKTSQAGGRSYFLPAKPTPEEIRKVLADDAGIHPALEVAAGDTGNWLHVLHRQKAGRDVFLICNQNHEGAARPFTFKVAAEGQPECWDPMRNEITVPAFRRIDANSVEVDLTLEPSESVLLVFQEKKRPLPARLAADAKCIREPIPLVRVPVKEAAAGNLQEKKPEDTKSLDGCSWVWYPEGNAAASAPPGACCFRKAISLPNKTIKSATFRITCDNDFTLYVNGAKVGASDGGEDNWRALKKVDVAKRLRPGPNQLAIQAVNGGDTPNPAGLIGRLVIEFDQGESMSVPIDKTWKAAKQEPKGWEQPGFDDSAWPAAKELVAFGGPPWGRLGGGGGGLNRSPVAASDPFVGRCELPADLDLAKSRLFLVMDALTPEEAARVTVNGTYAGGIIGKPLRLEVTPLLKHGANTIRIEPFAPKTAHLAVYGR